MSSLTGKLMACAIGLTLVAAASVPADAAKARKHTKVAAAHPAVRVQTGYWGTNLVPAGPIYNGNEYLGDDPDPNIRFQILRDLGARNGGND
jgi:hypothetical protein